MRWLRYIVAYAVWGVFSVASYVIGDVARQAAFSASIVLSGANPYVVRLFDRVFFVLAGLVWLALVVLMESVYRQSVTRGDLSHNMAKTIVGLAGLLITAQSVYLVFTPGSLTQSNIAILAGAALALGAGIIGARRLRRLHAPK